MAKVLLTTIHRPLGIDKDSSAENIQAEMYNSQVTRAQGAFGLRAICTGWGLEYIAANLSVPTTVLHYPTKRRFIKELKKGYDYVGISFVICTFPKATELCSIVRGVLPEAKIVLGGYGTVLKECDKYADFVCREEGINFFRRLLRLEEKKTFKVPQIRRKLKVMSITSQPEAVLAIGLGCSRGCDFCCTSHFFDRQYVPLLKSGREIHDAMVSFDFDGAPSRNIAVIDEDFLLDRERTTDMGQLNARLIDKPILFSCLTSLKSLSQYSLEELISMGLSGAWVGIESKKAKYAKLRNLNPDKMISDFKSVGIVILTSMILGYDWHDKKAIEEDFQYLISLKPTLSQFMLYSPCPQTPLYRRMVKENRLDNIPYKYRDGFHLMFKHPHFSADEIESILLKFIHWEYEELGPSIFRVLEVQLLGYQSWKDSPRPLFRARAEAHKQICLEIYPLLKIGIQKAPSHRVKLYLKTIKEQIEDLFQITTSCRIRQAAAPFIYHYTQLTDRLFPIRQPRSEISHYNLDSEEYL